MSNHVGNEGKVKIGANQVAEMRGWEVQEQADTVDDTVSGDDWKTHKVTHKGWTATANCLWDETDTNGQQACTVGASVTLNLYPEGDGAGDTYKTGAATVTQVGVSSTHDGIVERTIQFQGNGALTETTV